MLFTMCVCEMIFQHDNPNNRKLGIHTIHDVIDPLCFFVLFFLSFFFFKECPTKAMNSGVVTMTMIPVAAMIGFFVFKRARLTSMLPVTKLLRTTYCRHVAPSWCSPPP